MDTSTVVTHIDFSRNADSDALFNQEQIANMRERGTPTRLEIHRLKFHQNSRRGSLLTIGELSSAEKDIIAKEVMKDIRVQKLTFVTRSDSEIWDAAYLEVLSDWGVICHHPVRSLEVLKGRRGHRCTLCECIVLPVNNVRSAVAGE